VGISFLKKKVVVTGGAGFIGSHLVDLLVSRGNEVVVFDNLSSGRRSRVSDSAIFMHGSILSDNAKLREALEGASCVYHLAANADVRDGWLHPRLDFEQNVDATCSVLEAACSEGVEEIVFSSTGSVYGEASTFPTSETEAFPIQTSLYGASKVAAESFIQAYAKAQKIRATIFRFVSVLGPRYSHGHVIDFVRKLQENPLVLDVLGDGHQKKSYMDVADCVSAVAQIRGSDTVEVFNLGQDSYVSVRESLAWICDEMGLGPELRFGTSDRGWIGDNPFIWLDTAKVRATGWTATTPIEESVRSTVRWLLENPNEA
jgi:UDP-glucose 4-epimerase